jgi:hypothetical protein
VKENAKPWKKAAMAAPTTNKNPIHNRLQRLPFRWPLFLYLIGMKNLPLTFISLACALLFSFHSRASIMQASGSVGSNGTWNTDTVQVVGDVFIAVGCTLTIDPGTFIEMMGYYSFQSSGTIRAYGAVNDSIRFTYYDTTNLANQATNSGGWSGFYVQNTNAWLALSDSSIFDYCIFEYMKEGTGWNAGNLTWVNSSRVRFSNCEFRYNYQPHYRAAIYARDSSCFLVKRCYFHDNQGGNGGGITMYDGSSLTIEWCTFYNNHVVYTGGAIHAQNNCSPRIVNNFICNNYTNTSNCGPADGGGGIRLIYGGNAYVANNVIANNLTGVHGGGIECLWGATATLEYNTIVNNAAPGGYGCGLFVQESSVTLNNNIFWGNRSFGTLNYEIDYFSADSITVFTGDVVNNCIEGDTSALLFTNGFTYGGSIYYNFDSVPQFVAPSAGAGIAYDGLAADWTLLAPSDCINRGYGATASLPAKDAYGNPRMSGWQRDVGAYEAPAPDGIEETNTSSLTISPNPCSTYFTISLDGIGENELVNVSVYDVTGQAILEVTQHSGEKITLPESCSAGIFLVVVTCGDITATTKLIRN